MNTLSSNSISTGYDLGWRFTPMKGKRPFRKGWNSEETASLEQVLKWKEKYNIGLRTGSASGIVVLDVDSEKGGEVPEGLPETVTVQTGGGGLHFYFLQPEGEKLRNSAGSIAPHVDFKAENGVVVYPGSIHPDTGTYYEWMPCRSPEEIKVAPLPDWLLEQVESESEGFPVTMPKPKGLSRLPMSYLDKALEEETIKVACALEGERNDRLNRSAFVLGGLHHRGLDHSTVERKLVAAAMDNGLSEAEAQRTFSSGWTSGLQHPRSISLQRESVAGKQASINEEPLSDLASAHRLSSLAGGKLLHTNSQGWLYWDGKRWMLNKKAVVRLAHGIGKRVRDEAQEFKEPHDASRYFSHARRCESAVGINAILKLAEAIVELDGNEIQWDGLPWKLNCINGTIDLYSGNLEEHCQFNHITKLCPHSYKPEAEAPRWKRFLEEVFDGDSDLIAYMQWLCGYSLTGDITAQVFFILYGEGANGKTTLVNILQYILGPDYAIQLNGEELAKHKFSRHSTGLTDLYGIRLASTSETAESGQLNETLIKTITGGDPLRARRMGRDYFEFNPQVKLFFSTNHRPLVHDLSEGMWRRIRLIPFTQSFQGKKCDPNLMDSLKSEAEGILAWMVEGAVQSADGEPPLPKVVQQATEAYRGEQDTLKQFIDEMCVISVNQKCPKREFHSAYREWCGGKGLGERELLKRMRSKGYQDRRVSGGHSAWIGIGLHE